MARPGPEGGLYRPLSEAQIQQIHQASLQVLAETGLHVDNENALAIYHGGGAQIDGHCVRLPEAMVKDALETVPHRVLLAGRDASQDVVLEGRRVYAGTGGSPTMVLDPGASTVRPGTLRDLASLARLADALPHCDFIVIPLHPTDVADDEDVPVNRFYTCLTNSRKHIMSSVQGRVGSLSGAQQVIELGTMIAGSLQALQARPFISCITSWMVSPLHLDTGVTEILIEWCRHGLPLALSSAPMAGSTSPVTLAGTLVQLNAEQLSGIVLTQLVRPGTPVLAGYIPGVADMRSGGYLGGAIEFGMMQAAAAQLAHFYRVPIYGSGGMSDSKLPDAQSGYEKMATLLLAAMGGCNYIHHAISMVTNMSAASLEQAVIDDEMVGMVMRLLRGIEVTNATLAVEAIGRVGPGGHYLMDDHTLQFMRSELFQPRLADRRNRAAWEAAGQPDSRDHAIARVEELLQAHKPPSLPPDLDRAIRDRFNIQ
ncbi:MAG: trimethylamine methyltransferase family protein [Anaerolineae bacterium]|jgi:trimethylamine--corrinoid protein Co-methyltransferase